MGKEGSNQEEQSIGLESSLFLEVENEIHWNLLGFGCDSFFVCRRQSMQHAVSVHSKFKKQFAF